MKEYKEKIMKKEEELVREEISNPEVSLFMKI